MNIKVKREYIVLMVLILLVGVLTITFAYFGVSIVGEPTGDSELQTGTFELSFSDSSVNISNLAPIYDSFYPTQAYSKDFTITNNNTSTINSCVKLYLKFTTLPLELSSNNIKYTIISSDEYTRSGDFDGASEDSDFEIANSLFFETGETKSFTLYIWLSYDSLIDQSSLLGLSFNASIVSEGIDVRTQETCVN